MTDLAAELELPQYKHLPGSNPRPDCSYLESIARQAHSLTEHNTANTNIAWHYGIRLLNNGYYWEAHEVLETVWMNALPNSRERFLLQAVIHLANARLKANMGRHQAVSRLSALAMGCLERAYAACAVGPLMGVACNELEHLLLQATQGEHAGCIKLIYQQ